MNFHSAKRLVRQRLNEVFHLHHRRFILSVGDEGAILILMRGAALEKRLFLRSPHAEEWENLVKEYPSVPIYLLADVADQTYLQHSFPPVSPLNIGQLVKRRLQKDFGSEEMKAARRLYRDKTGRKDWNYLFVGLANTPPFSLWLEAVQEMPNPFGGIYLLPVEAESFIKKLSLAKDKEKNTQWHILISHHRVGGFRQILFKGGKILFTRIIQPVGGTAPEAVAGNIEQEALNTLEYSSRLGLNDKANLEVYIIAGRDVLKVLDVNAIGVPNIHMLTPSDAAEKLKLTQSVESTDRYGDVLLAASFATSKPTLKLQTPVTKQVEMFQNARVGLYAGGILLAPLLVILSLIKLGTMVGTFQDVSVAENERLQKQQALNRAEDVKNALPANSDRIVDVVKINHILSRDSVKPLQLLDEFAKIKKENSLRLQVKKFAITVNDDPAGAGGFKAAFAVIFPSNNVELLLEEIDRLASILRTRFADYTVQFSGLPTGEIELDANRETRPIEVIVQTKNYEPPKVTP